MYHALGVLGQVATMAFDASKLYATKFPTFDYWFERFMLGLHKRMGDKVVSDAAISTKLMMELEL